MLRVGVDAPDFELTTASDRRVVLSAELRTDGHVLLIFLRHLG